MIVRRLLFGTILALLALCAAGQTPAPAQDKSENPGGGRGNFGRAKMGGEKAGDLKRYDDVVTKAAKSFPGVFTVHRIDDKVLFEIPKEALDRLMLFQTEVVKGPAGVSWGGQSIGQYFIRWERRANKINLWRASFAKRAEGMAIQNAVDSANQETIIGTFPVLAEGKDRTAVIDATSLYMSELADLPVRRAVGNGQGIDDSRSYLEEVKAFPTNIEVRALLTFRSGGAGGGGPGGGRGPAAQAGAGAPARSLTAVVHSSLVMLPEKPMMGRFFDPRVGYFTESFTNFASPTKWSEEQQYIARFRLEKKDPSAELSEPVKPIVFYISREVPEKWRSYMMKGVEDWKPAFEKAGFKNAIIAKEAPDPRQDPTWDAEDASHSVIRWVAEPIANAMGPNVHDPRSGEIISAHIIFWHDILKLTQEW